MRRPRTSPPTCRRRTSSVTRSRWCITQPSIRSTSCAIWSGKRGWEKSRIGVDLDAPYYTARCHQHMRAGLPQATITDNAGLVNWARLVKSQAELGLMREAGQLITATMNRAIEKLAPGVPQHHVIAEIYHAQIASVPGIGGDYTSLCPLIQVGEGTSTPHLTWSDEPLPNNALVVLEIGAGAPPLPCAADAHLSPGHAAASGGRSGQGDRGRRRRRARRSASWRKPVSRSKQFGKRS